MGDFAPDGLDSRSLQTPWEWKNRVILKEHYIFNVAIPRGVPNPRFEKSGSFKELFAGSGGVTCFLRRRGETDCAALEAHPAASDDGGLKAPECRAERDLLSPMVVLSLLVDISWVIMTTG